MLIELGSDTTQFNILLIELGFKHIFTKPLNHANHRQKIRNDALNFMESRATTIGII